MAESFFVPQQLSPTSISSLMEHSMSNSSSSTTSSAPTQPNTILSQTKSHVKGRMFLFMRHPVEREVSFFYSLKNATHNPLYNEDIEIYELSDWLKSNLFMDNLMVRSLIRNFDKMYTITLDDLLVAKEILRRKCLIGLMDGGNNKGLSWDRFEKYFQYAWGIVGTSANECKERMLHWGWKNRNPRRPDVEHVDLFRVSDGKIRKRRRRRRRLERTDVLPNFETLSHRHLAKADTKSDQDEKMGSSIDNADS
eukprot:CAMPEP_0184857218 /NCGR_PEP_ID=MMETSP0580-20130426/2383_1 /TAXON_ID=1118495 /ORGANISM="Dactyliosolen fragilissimus" /LENGTH=251 /DNA_ID=CAMNT_0027352687 /DNA_START=86 /DNA_END=837 /DNA_ORIENTATION=+